MSICDLLSVLQARLGMDPEEGIDGKKLGKQEDWAASHRLESDINPLSIVRFVTAKATAYSNSIINTRPFDSLSDMISKESDSVATENTADSAVAVKASGSSYWRSISQYRGEAEFSEYLDREFPVAASEFPEGVSRRRWMQLMGASLAIAGVAGCRYPKETIEPFVIRPEGRVPGESYQRATSFELAGRVYNLLVSCVDGRPLKVEPNNAHPNAAGTDAYSQASVLQLYDPDRARGDEGFLLRKGDASGEGDRRFEVDWSEFDPVGKSLIDSAGDGGQFAVLMSPTSSPSLVRMVETLKKRLPKATVCQYDGVSGGVMGQATKALFGKQAQQTLNLADADVVVALQADILGLTAQC